MAREARRGGNMTNPNPEKAPSEIAMAEYLGALMQANVYISNAGSINNKFSMLPKMDHAHITTLENITLKDLVSVEPIVENEEIGIKPTALLHYGCVDLEHIGTEVQTKQNAALHELNLEIARQNSNLVTKLSNFQSALGSSGRIKHDYEMLRRNDTPKQDGMYNDYVQKFDEAFAVNCPALKHSIKVTFDLGEIVSIGNRLLEELDDMAKNRYIGASEKAEDIRKAYKALSTEKIGFLGLKRTVKNLQGLHSVTFAGDANDIEVKKSLLYTMLYQKKT